MSKEQVLQILFRSLLAALVLLLSASPVNLALTHPTVDKGAQSLEWRVVTSPTIHDLRAVDMVTASEGWAVGDDGVILHWDGSAWMQMSSPVATTLESVDMVSDTDGWAVGHDGTILQWDGSEWITTTSPVAHALYSVDMISATDGWAVGLATTLHWNGDAWIEVSNSLSEVAYEALHSVSMVSSTYGWAVGAGHDPIMPSYHILVHWNGSEWTQVASPVDAGVSESVAMVSATDGWAVGWELMRWGGAAWTVKSSLSGNSVAMYSATHGWIVGDGGAIRKYDGDSWSGLTSPTTETLNSVVTLSIADSWAVGENGVILHYGFGESANWVYLPLVFRKFAAEVCEEILVKEKIWQGELASTCDPSFKTDGQVSLKLSSDTFSIAERYSRLISVESNQTYEVSYWVKTDLEIDGAELYGRVVAAQYNAQAKESDEINEHRIDSGFTLGESVGGQTDWAFKSYTFTTDAETKYVRLRAFMGGPVGTAKGRFWLDQVSIQKQ
jgi:hypothetical protein